MTTNTRLDLDLTHATELAPLLRKAADAYRETHSELASAWQDKNAGAVWSALANILDHAADKADAACERAGLSD